MRTDKGLGIFIILRMYKFCDLYKVFDIQFEAFNVSAGPAAATVSNIIKNSDCNIVVFFKPEVYQIHMAAGVLNCSMN